MAANNPLFDFSQPRVMAILNVTPDSFFAGSRMPDAPHVERRVREAVAEGASIIDVGGYSSRPGADEVSPDEEWRRVELGVEAVRRLAPGMAISVDTFRSEVAARAIERFGPLIINDISAGELDPAMPAVAAKYGVPYIAMHMKGDPKTMQSLTDYKRDITAEVVAYFEARVAALLAAGIAREHLVLDPGFGFAKTTEQNYELLAGLHRLCALGYPVLAGLSRKSMIYRVLGVTPAQSLAGTVALGWECLRQGAAILRVHDVREAVDTVRIFNAYVQNSGEICQMKK
ncbi:dihydropteroate synthase [uncultured Alistipes sp.]|uniref:dihydropteroate synthase n=1 Tax=uncultured Alistipes sp. TaxID=538949 RepID=UPI00259AAAC7|nr:dihydropteroate synthase [uncultured Alistipes sp.]